MSRNKKTIEIGEIKPEFAGVYYGDKIMTITDILKDMIIHYWTVFGDDLNEPTDWHRVIYEGLIEKKIVNGVSVFNYYDEDKNGEEVKEGDEPKPDINGYYCPNITTIDKKKADKIIVELIKDIFDNYKNRRSQNDSFYLCPRSILCIRLCNRT